MLLFSPATVQPTKPHKTQQTLDLYLRPLSSPQNGTAHIVTESNVVSSDNPTGGTATTASPRALTSQACEAQPIGPSSKRRIIVDGDDGDAATSVQTHDASAVAPQALASRSSAAHPAPAADGYIHVSTKVVHHRIIIDTDDDDNVVTASVPTHDAAAAAPQALASQACEAQPVGRTPRRRIIVDDDEADASTSVPTHAAAAAAPQASQARAAQPSPTADTVARASVDDDSNDNFAVFLQPVGSAATTSRPANTAAP